MNRGSRWLSIGCALVLAGCSGVAQRARDQETQERYLSYAGAPIVRFSYFGRLDSWSVLSDSQLVVWTRVNDAYLLSVQQPCSGLRFTSRIGVSSTMGTVNRGLDSVLFEGQTCPIEEIRPVDYKRMLAERRSAPHQPE